jgi:hypothetical protein
MFHRNNMLFCISFECSYICKGIWALLGNRPTLSIEGGKIFIGIIRYSVIASNVTKYVREYGH